MRFGRPSSSFGQTQAFAINFSACISLLNRGAKTTKLKDCQNVQKQDVGILNYIHYNYTSPCSIFDDYQAVSHRDVQFFRIALVPSPERTELCSAGTM